MSDFITLHPIVTFGIFLILITLADGVAGFLLRRK